MNSLSVLQHKIWYRQSNSFLLPGCWNGGFTSKTKNLVILVVLVALAMTFYEYISFVGIGRERLILRLSSDDHVPRIHSCV